ncbi:Tat pathway signal sequence domain protein [Amycolatopsis sp. FDAARGOS 1241]|uniref:glycosyl hydrolase family 95 catalytic domain-containing protein n=1 Tax=Amycolatopsis sp. FDAARGOS 1241 TaxID=2778070 RepID=UPI0019524577|nr:Tat pathway signal sequence domain protein [Amycolatopsis sp. FDAARGOS 1241]QRP43277.1 Tat pathway signal sequence domain protein [Amycolatopsis sp. FDAARGOS 1241]
MDVSRRTVLGGALAGLAATAAGGGAAASAASASDPGGDDFDWAAFLATADLRWRRMPTAWTEGPFLGNGFLGSGIYAEPGKNAVRINVQHSEVQDHRPQYGALFGLARLPIGYFTLEPVGAITGVDWRLDLWHAELTGTITTAAGSLAVRAIVHTGQPLLAVEVRPSEGERGFRWTFHPAEAVSPRADPVWKKAPPAGYAANPPAIIRRAGDSSLAEQPLLAGGEHVTAWRDVTRGGTRTLYASVAWSHPERTSAERALRAVRTAGEFGVLTREHRRWWHDHYRRSFVSLPDTRLQSFYWIQLYKLASAARRDAPVMATSGPWLENTPWPATWWNLNVQLECWLIHGSNHLELDAVSRALGQYRANLSGQLAEPYRADSAGIPRTTDLTLDNGISDATSGFPVGIPGQDPPVPEVGNLTWALHNVWLSYRHTLDGGLLRDTLFPLLRKAISYYLHFLGPGADGRLHLPPTFSPEYGVDAPDCTYDLALLRWGCRTLLDLARELRVSDPLAPRWRDVLANLAPYAVDGNVYMIGAGVPFAKSHRHYSHLLQVYPLYEITWEQPENRVLIEKSLAHWVGFEGALQGYSFTGAASISAAMLRGDQAAGYLGELQQRYLEPNTMYQESGPVIETPLSAVESMQDMLVQSWGGVLRLFPAVAASWGDLALRDFRTEGAFLLSASREAGKTRWLKVHSEAGAPCVLRPGIDGELAVTDARGRAKRWRRLPNGDVQVDLARGEDALVHRAGDRPDFAVRPVSPGGPGVPWGLP